MATRKTPTQANDRHAWLETRHALFATMLHSQSGIRVVEPASAIQDDKTQVAGRSRSISVVLTIDNQPSALDGRTLVSRVLTAIQIDELLMRYRDSFVHASARLTLESQGLIYTTISHLLDQGFEVLEIDNVGHHVFRHETHMLQVAGLVPDLHLNQPTWYRFNLTISTDTQW